MLGHVQAGAGLDAAGGVLCRALAAQQLLGKIFLKFPWINTGNPRRKIRRGVFSLFPAEEAEGEEGAEGGQGEHDADRGQDAARTDAEEPGKRAAQPDATRQRRRGQRRQRHEAVDDVHGQLDAQHEHRADRRHAEALEDLQLPQAGYGLRLSMARKRLSRPLTGAACFAIFRHE